MSGGIPKRITRMKIGIGYKPISGRWGLQGLETCARRNKVLCQYVKRRTGKSSLVWRFGSELNNGNFLIAIDWWFGIPINRNKYKVPPDSRTIIISIFGQIEDWKTDGVTNMANAFSASRNPKAATFNENIGGGGGPGGKWYTRQVTTMENMFKGATSFNQNIMIWNTQDVENMSGMFNGATNFNNGGVTSNWNNLSNVTNMSSMFKNALSFNQNIINWFTSGVKDMSYMFSGARDFNQPLSGGNFDTTDVTTMKGMFQAPLGFGTTSFNNPLLSWDTTKVEDMSFMFKNAKFDQKVNEWDTSALTNVESMFQGAEDFDNLTNDMVTAAPQWTMASVTNMKSMFEDAKKFNRYVGGGSAVSPGWNTTAVTTMARMFKGADLFNQSLDTNGTGWKVENVLDFSQMFSGASVFNSDISEWEPLGTGGSANMTGMFEDATHFNTIIDNWDVSNVSNMASMFKGAHDFDGDIDAWAVQNVTDMSSMFNGALHFNQDISSWSLGSITDMSSMFKDATSFNQNLQTWDISSILTSANLANCFNGATTLNQTFSDAGGGGTWYTTAEGLAAVASISNFYTDGTNYITGGVIGKQPILAAIVWTDGQLTSKADLLKAIDWWIEGGVYKNAVETTPGPGSIETWFTGLVFDMSEAFKNGRVRAAPLGGTLDSTTFNDDIGNWNTAAVTDMSEMFMGAAAFNQPLPYAGINNKWKTTIVTDMSSMFKNASNFNQDLSSWETSNVTTMEDIFEGSGVNSQDWKGTSNWRDTADLIQPITGFYTDGSNYTTGSHPPVGEGPEINL